MNARNKQAPDVPAPRSIVFIIWVATTILLLSSTFGAPARAWADSPEAWKDPYPPTPTENDPAFVGAKWHVGSTVDGEPLEYLAEIPEGDSTALPVIVVGGANDDNLHLFGRLRGAAIAVYIGPSPLSGSGGVHNAWLLPKPDSPSRRECSPACPFWMFVPAEAIRDVLADLARHVRFAHDRVQMFGYSLTRYDIYRALDPILQPYFAGVAHGIYAEWQQATCPDAAKPTASPPRVFFSWGKCDQSFCVTMDCMDTLKSNGYAIDPESKGDTTLESCPCPETGRRPHLLGASTQVWDATYQWLLSNVRK